MARLTAIPRENVRSATIPIAAAMAPNLNGGGSRVLYGSCRNAPHKVQAPHLRASVLRPKPGFICENNKVQPETYNTNGMVWYRRYLVHVTNGTLQQWSVRDDGVFSDVLTRGVPYTSISPSENGPRSTVVPPDPINLSMRIVPKQMLYQVVNISYSNP